RPARGGRGGRHLPHLEHRPRGGGGDDAAQIHHQVPPGDHHGPARGDGELHACRGEGSAAELPQLPVLSRGGYSSPPAPSVRSSTPRISLRRDTITIESTSSWLTGCRGRGWLTAAGFSQVSGSPCMFSSSRMRRSS